MIFAEIAIILLSLIAGVAKSIKDTVNFSFRTSILHEWGWDETYWVREVSAYRKWKNGDREQGERFLGSSTILVAFTDGWHLMAFIELNSLFLSFALIHIFYPQHFLILMCTSILLYRLYFEGNFRYLNNKK